MVYYVYILQNIVTRMLYIGFTTNLRERVLRHQKGKSLFTQRNKKGGRWKLIYFEGYPNRKDAESREKFLKGGSGRNYLKRQLRNFYKKT